jgi:hypothetical protein
MLKGDFSRWHYRRRDNFNGVLPQQGRVLLDADGTAQSRIVTDWQDVAAEDIIGAGAAAVPSDRPDSFHIGRARVQGSDVIVTVEPGRIWADGRLVHLEEAAAVDRVATYLQPPVQNPPGTVAGIAAGVRDAVVLEVWREAINGFQLPDLLIEPALGGPDTAERIYTASAFRLYRMGAGDTCASIPIADDFSGKGKLKVTLQPTVTSGGDCPVVEGGGYTGFEHHLYRVEVADVASGGPMFKWSRFNGGLVGRGIFDAAAKRVNITANFAAITTCGLSGLYLEAEEFDAQQGMWRVTYGAPVTLNSSNQLVLPAAATFGTIPSSPASVFFRLWDGLKTMAGFPVSANPVELEDGIRLEFEAAATGKYAPRDYWTFPVRAAGVGNPQVLVDSRPPEGIHHHRVALGVITWNAGKDATSDAGEISDCRDPFNPLTRMSSCCTVRVGDGVSSHGNYKTIQAAVNALPASGGEVCVLPGTYREHVVIKGRVNIRIHGCGPRSRIVGSTRDIPQPVILIQNSRGIRIDSLAIEAEPRGQGILLDDSASEETRLLATNRITRLRDIELLDLRITAQGRSAIETRAGQFVRIRHCDIRMIDAASSWPGIFFIGDDGEILCNQVRVRSKRQLDDGTTLPVPASAALGGIQIGGTSDRVRIIDNLIQGGIGNGITLGSVVVVDTNGRDLGSRIGWAINPDDPCNPCKPGTTYFPPGKTSGGNRTISAGALTGIRIERNRIYDMGLNGIGVAAFFDLKQDQETITVLGLSILGNHIRGCLRRPIEEIPSAMLKRIGYGGIALADVTGLVVWDNTIEDNGPRRTDPVCGIFLLMGEGIDISRNIIVNNGARTEEPVTSAKPGQRGGIVILHALAPMLEIDTRAVQQVQSDRPALRVHDNVVVAPMGRALSVTALGAVSVVANEFVSQAVTPLRAGSTDAFVASTVCIYNLGRNFEFGAWKAGYGTIRAGNFQTDNAYSLNRDTFKLSSRGTVDAAVRIFLNGQVLFADNQVTLDVAEPGISLAVSSIAIYSLDDIGFTGNQSMAQLADDFLFTNTILFGASLRAVDNRWEEPIGNAPYSALTLGMMNATVNNIATHCIVAFAPPKLLVASPNIILLGQFVDDPCALAAKLLAKFGAAAGGGQ